MSQDEDRSDADVVEGAPHIHIESTRLAFPETALMPKTPVDNLERARGLFPLLFHLYSERLTSAANFTGRGRCSVKSSKRIENLKFLPLQNDLKCDYAGCLKSK